MNAGAMPRICFALSGGGVGQTTLAANVAGRAAGPCVVALPAGRFRRDATFAEALAAGPLVADCAPASRPAHDLRGLSASVIAWLSDTGGIQGFAA